MIIELLMDLLKVGMGQAVQDGRFERSAAPKRFSRTCGSLLRPIRTLVKEGSFRKDLFYRLNVFPLNIPPLSDRRDDIPQLVWFFVKEFSRKMGKTVEQIPKRTMDLLQNYYWPGNIRELKNVIERAMI